MNKHVPTFGNDATFDELADRIRGFSHDDASVTEQGKMVAACKLLAEETVKRWDMMRLLERELREKVSMAELRERMNEVLAVDAPRSRFQIRWPR